MKNLNINVKITLPNAVIPTYAHKGDAGLDLTAVSCKYNKDYDYWEYDTGLAIEIPEGYVGLIFPRSSNRKTDVYYPNSVAVIDSPYRGNILICFKNRDKLSFIKKIFNYKSKKPYNIGDRVGQLIIMPYPTIKFNEVKELSKTERGEGGFGSTGN